jgi:hypothetical protein
LNPVAWTLLGIGVGLLVGIFKYLFDLNREVGELKQNVGAAKLGDMRTQVDRLMYRQELQDGRAATDVHSPHTPDLDALVEGLMHRTLDEDQLHTVVCALDEAMKTERNGTKWLNMGFLSDRAKAELQDKAKAKAKGGDNG